MGDQSRAVGKYLLDNARHGEVNLTPSPLVNVVVLPPCPSLLVVVVIEVRGIGEAGVGLRSTAGIFAGVLVIGRQMVGGRREDEWKASSMRSPT
jgi:hypothetical protein